MLDRGELRLLALFRPWLRQAVDLASDEHRRPFYQDALVVLDTNVLLDLYRYTPAVREQVLTLLRVIGQQRRLWLPYQVGLEFVRNRERTIKERGAELTRSRQRVRGYFEAASNAIDDAAGLVARLMQDLAGDEVAGGRLTEEINRDTARAFVRGWEERLCKQVEELRKQHDVSMATIAKGDPVLDAVAKLFGNDVGDAPDERVEAERVRHALEHRFPNRIPPGFADAAAKSSDIRRTADYLLWEEILIKAAELPPPRRVIFVSRDTKADWYEHDDKGRPVRPLPELAAEMRRRAGADLLLETTQAFLKGAEVFLDVELSENAYEEVERAARPVSEAGGTDDSHSLFKAPDALVEQACRAAGLVTSETRVRALSDKRFAWWLLVITAKIGFRDPGQGEPEVRLVVVTPGSARPASDWQEVEVVVAGKSRSAVVVPWLADVLAVVPQPDLDRLKRLIGVELAECP